MSHHRDLVVGQWDGAFSITAKALLQVGHKFTRGHILSLAELVVQMGV